LGSGGRGGGARHPDSNYALETMGNQ
jgi:hypothetical protein